MTDSLAERSEEFCLAATLDLFGWLRSNTTYFTTQDGLNITSDESAMSQVGLAAITPGAKPTVVFMYDRDEPVAAAMFFSAGPVEILQYIGVKQSKQKQGLAQLLLSWYLSAMPRRMLLRRILITTTKIHNQGMGRLFARRLGADQKRHIPGATSDAVVYEVPLVQAVARLGVPLMPARHSFEFPGYFGGRYRFEVLYHGLVGPDVRSTTDFTVADSLKRQS